MSTKDQLNKIKEIVGGFEKSTWIEEARARRANSEEIRLRQKIALNILRTTRQLNISQKQLAEMLKVSPQQVNKWVKGTENFAIGTIFKIQTVLDIKLIEVAEPKIILRTSERISFNGSYNVSRVTSISRLDQPLQIKIKRQEKYNQPRRLAYA